MQRPDLEYVPTHAEYRSYLARSRVAIALNNNWYGGLSIREAILHGCFPVCLDVPCYRELVGYDWPHMTTLDPSSIARTCLSALSGADITVPLCNARAESYQANIAKVLHDLLP